MNLEERMERLEKLYEKIYHDYELLAIYVPRLTDILIKYWGASGNHRESIRIALTLLDKEMQEHFKSHLDEKKKWANASKRRPKPYKGVNIVANNNGKS